MPELLRFTPGEGKPLRCDVCGEQIGEWFGNAPPDPEKVDLKCYACAAVGEAERITEGA